jgi:hypothetical protein
MLPAQLRPSGRWPHRPTVPLLAGRPPLVAAGTRAGGWVHAWWWSVVRWFWPGRFLGVEQFAAVPGVPRRGSTNRPVMAQSAGVGRASEPGSVRVGHGRMPRSSKDPCLYMTAANSASLVGVRTQPLAGEARIDDQHDQHDHREVPRSRIRVPVVAAPARWAAASEGSRHVPDAQRTGCAAGLAGGRARRVALAPRRRPRGAEVVQLAHAPGDLEATGDEAEPCSSPPTIWPDSSQRRRQRLALSNRISSPTGSRFERATTSGLPPAPRRWSILAGHGPDGLRFAGRLPLCPQRPAR